MKAQFVYENLDFERGGDNINRQIGIGKYRDLSPAEIELMKTVDFLIELDKQREDVIKRISTDHARIRMEIKDGSKEGLRYVKTLVKDSGFEKYVDPSPSLRPELKRETNFGRISKTAIFYMEDRSINLFLDLSAERKKIVPSQAGWLYPIN